MSTARTGITVIPAYRVVAHFVRQARLTAGEAPAGFHRDATVLQPPSRMLVPPTSRGAALDALERLVRDYVRHSLAGLHASWAEIGVHWAVTQLGDPDLDALDEALAKAEAADPKGLVEATMRRASDALARPDLSAKVLLLPGDGASRVLTQSMRGAMGISLGSQATLLLVWPSGSWKDALVYTMAHEYAHLVRNHLFPRSIAGGRPVYTKTGEPETLLDAMVAEGIADVFAGTLFPEWTPPWLTGIDRAALRDVWLRMARRLSVANPSEVRRFVFGDGDRIPQWAGYYVGHVLCRGYLERHEGVRPSALVGLTAAAIFQGSGAIEALDA